MFKLGLQKSGSAGLIITVVGGVMLAISFTFAYQTFELYLGLAQKDFGSSSAGFIGNLNNLLEAAIVVMFLGIMGWVGSIFLLRGVDFMKVDRGVGIVTFKVDKGVGVVSSVDVVSGNAKSFSSKRPPALDFSSGESTEKS